MDYNDVLMHFGVKGMRWGVRNAESKNRIARDESEDYSSTKKLRKQPVSTLSNSELRKVNERIQLEQTYKQLTSKDISKGWSVSKKLLGRVGNKIFDAVVQAGVNEGIKAGKNAIFGTGEEK